MATATTPARVRVRDVMTPEPVTLEFSSTVAAAAMTMKGADIGPLPVIGEDGKLCGIVTDRDIVVRVIAEGRDPSKTTVGDIASNDPFCLQPDATVTEAIQLMRDHAIRRVPIVDQGEPVGIVALGDLARNADPHSALADISTASPNT